MLNNKLAIGFALGIAIVALIIAIVALILIAINKPLVKWNVVNGKSSDIAITGSGNLYYYASTITSLTVNRPNSNPVGEQLIINNQVGTSDIVILGGAGVTISGQGRVLAGSSTTFIWTSANTLQQQFGS